MKQLGPYIAPIRYSPLNVFVTMAHMLQPTLELVIHLGIFLVAESRPKTNSVMVDCYHNTHIYV